MKTSGVELNAVCGRMGWGVWWDVVVFCDKTGI